MNTRYKGTETKKHVNEPMDGIIVPKQTIKFFGSKDDCLYCDGLDLKWKKYKTGNK